MTVAAWARAMAAAQDEPPTPPAQGDLDPGFAAAGQAVTDLSGQFSEAYAVAVQPDGRIVTAGTTGPAPGPGRAGDVAVLRYNADGTPDPTFGTGGVVTADPYGELDQAAAVAVQADGKIVVVGSTNGRTQSSDVLVLRFNPDGTPDTGFGDGGGGGGGGGGSDLGGRVTVDIGDADAAYSLAIQPADQKIVVGGTAASSFMVLRLGVDGVLDESFGGDGIVLTGGFNGERVNGIAVQPDGRIVGVGPSFGDVAVFRLNPDGDNDFTFGQSYGFTYTDLGGDADATAVALRPDGTIAVAGRAGGSVAVLRYDSFGFLDDSFDGGVVYVDRSEGSEWSYAIVAVGERVIVSVDSAGPALLSLEFDAESTPGFGESGEGGGLAQVPFDSPFGLATTPDGRLAAAGSTRTALGVDSVAALFDIDTGAPDETFGEDGVVTTDVRSPGDELTAVTLDGLGRIIVAGHSGTGSGWDHAVARYTSAGLDPTFGTGGRVVTDLGGVDRAYGVTAANGTITVVGDTMVDGRMDFALTRYWAFGWDDGRLDTFFDDDGIVTTSLTDGEEGARAAVPWPGGGVLVAGFADAGFALVRYLDDGALDPGFGDGGVVRTVVNGSFSQATAMAVQPDGLILVAGEVAEGEGGGTDGGVSVLADDDRYQGDRDFAVVRYLPDGQLDETFGDDGVVTTDLAGGNDEATSIAVQLDGGIVVAGRVFPGISALSEIGTPARIGVVRLNADGSFDESFGSFGQVIVDIADERQSVAAVAAIQDGDIVLGGLAGSDLAMVRLNFDGSLDGAFGDDGVVLTDLGGNDEARALLVPEGGSVIAAGVTRIASRTEFALVSYLQDGTLDPTFGSSGSVVTDIVGDVDEARALAVQPDGKVVIAGSGRVGPAEDLAVVRYDTDGTLDESFGLGGIAIVDVPGGPTGGHAVAVREDGAIVAVGDVDDGVVVVLLTPDGFLDTSLNETGMRIFDFYGGGVDHGRAVAIQPDGAIVVAGSAFHPGGEGQPSFDDFGVARLLPDGTFDESFGDGGRLTTDFVDGIDAGYALVLQPDGRIVVAGDHDGAAALARYEADGSLDETFGAAGLVLADLGGVGAVRGLALRPDGVLVVGGSVGIPTEPPPTEPPPTEPPTEPPPTEPPTSPTNPPPTEPPPPEFFAKPFLSFLAAQPQVGAGRDVLALRFDASGVIDPTFGVDGIARTAVDTDDTAGAVVVQPDGAVVVAATSGGDAALVRYRSDGVPDPRFGTTGVARSGGIAESAMAVALQPDGNLVVAGSTVGTAAPGALGDTDATVLRFVGGPAGPVGPPADLAIAMVASEAAVRIDTPLRYVITLRNDGPAQADAVTVTDELPPTVTLLGATAGQGEPCTRAGAELTCPLGTIAAGAEVGLTITVQPTQVGRLVNTASVAGDQQDLNPANDSASVTTSVLPLSAIRANPGVVQLGRVVQVIGSGFLPGTTVSLGYTAWPVSRTAVVAADGSFSVPFVVFAETTPGKRVVEARGAVVAGLPQEVLATTNLLVVTDSLTPPNFVGRN